MKKVWILMLVAAVALVACPVFMAMAQDQGGGDTGKGKGKGGFGKGGFGGPPVTLTDDQTTTMKPKVDALTTAAKALNTAASDEKALGATDGPRYTMQVIMQAVRDASPAPAATDSSGKGGKGGGGFGGKGGMTSITPTADQLTAIGQPKIDAVKAAVKDLSDLAKKTLGDTDGPRYTRQAAMEAARALGGMGGGGGKGGGKGGKKGGGDATPATT